ncbi:endonuclease-reverse transcriptase [Trichonephila clavipes]|nr:endonuclease-reverse transcriptase [Trichonephila clavipes]
MYAAGLKYKKYLSEPFITERGLRQADSLACLLFNLELEKCIRDSGLDRSGTLWNRSLQLLAYADDIDIIGRSEKAVKEAFKHLKSQPHTWASLSTRALQRTSSYTQVIRSNRLRWLGHIWRSPGNNQIRAYTFKNPMGSRTRGKPPTRGIDDVENDLKTLNIKNWQRVAAYSWNWRKRAVEAAKTWQSLSSSSSSKSFHSSIRFCHQVELPCQYIRYPYFPEAPQQKSEVLCERALSSTKIKSGPLEPLNGERV